MSPGYRAASAPSTRFEATTGPGRRAGILATLGINLLVVVMGGGHALLGDKVPQALTPLVPVVGIAIFLGGGALFYWIILRTRKVMLDVEGSGIVVDEGRAGTYPAASASLGPWLAWNGVVCGAVLHLTDGERAYRIGGLEHALPSAAAMPGTKDVETTLPRDAFVELLACLGSSPSPTGAPASARCRLIMNGSSPRGILRTMLPWLITMVLVSVLSAALGAAGLFQTTYGQPIGIGIMVAIIVGGLAVTIARSMRTEPSLELEVGPKGVRIHDVGKGRVVASAPPAAITRVCGVWRMTMRGSTYEYPILVLGVPGYGELSVCVQDPRFLWPGAPPLPAPRFLVGVPDWTVLVERLGLGSAGVANARSLLG